MNNPSIAFLGLGIMGTGMVRRLLSQGFLVKVWNRNLAKVEALKADGAKVASSAREAASGADVIIAMLADDAASRSVWMGENGALEGVGANTILVECSTLSVGWVRELAAMAKERGFTFIDAPVTGSKAQAAAGELNFLVGANGEIPEAVTQTLNVMGKSVTHLGPVGSGALVKLINNFVCGVQLVSIAEALAMIERTDLDRDKALGVLTNGAPGSPMVKYMLPRMTARDYTPNFLLKLLAKDLTYAIAEARSHSQDLRTAQTALKALQEAMPKHGEQDMSAVVEMFRSEKLESRRHG